MLLLVICLAYFSTLKMESICSSETSGSLRTTQRYNTCDRIILLLIFMFTSMNNSQYYRHVGVSNFFNLGLAVLREAVNGK
jgi:hypothetical protein